MPSEPNIGTLSAVRHRRAALHTRVSPVTNNQPIRLNVEDGNQVDYTSEIRTTAGTFGVYSLV